ncbi:MAG: ADP-ribosylglycohydrolase family protein [Isosphaeraceae bacterium]|nr:ADP-ribosylglycohydrolase family protein [Isosphaeraceae bacterium]
MISRQERIAGGLVGLLVGDALGVPYEFCPSWKIPPAEQIEFAPPPGFCRAHWGVPPGTWSDDGAHALCLLASLLEHGRFAPDDLGRRLLEWYLSGYMAVDGKVFDIGNQTACALAALKAGVPALEARPKEEQANGNGSLMRVLPLALWHHGSDLELVSDACAQSRVTHGHERSQVCCALYCLWARRTLEGADDAWGAAVASLRGLAPRLPSGLITELEAAVRPDDPPGGRGGGYVVDCLHSARFAVEAGGYEQIVKAAIALGDDTDTTAAVAGGIAGQRDGLGAIPARWVENLRGRELYEPLLETLLARG